MSGGASAAWNYRDRSEPPMIPGQALSLYFPHTDWERHPDRYAFDVRGSAEALAGAIAHVDGLDPDLWGYVWSFDVAKNFVVETAGDEVVLDFDGIESVPAEAEVFLVGSDEFISKRDDLPALPTRTALHQNYPNPFNPATIIRYEIARAGNVTLRIYDATGAFVRELANAHRTPGVYEVGWNGNNDQRQNVASGIYFYRLHARNTTQTKKMILLK